MDEQLVPPTRIPKDLRVNISPATQHACWGGERNAGSSEHLVGPGVPEGRPQGLQRACGAGGGAGLEAVEGEGALQAQRCQRAATAQAGTPGCGGALPCDGLEAPACPRLPSQPHAEPQQPSARWRGAARRGTLLSPCLAELEVFLFLPDMARVDTEHSESPCPGSTGLSPPHAPLPTLREKRDQGEAAAEAPDGWAPSFLPGQPQAAPSPLPSAHLTRTRCRTAGARQLLLCSRPCGSQWPCHLL